MYPSYSSPFTSTDLKKVKIDPRQSRTELLRNWAKAYGKGGAKEELYQKMMFAQVYNLGDASVLPDGAPPPWPQKGADRQAIAEAKIARQGNRIRVKQLIGHFPHADSGGNSGDAHNRGS